MQTNPNPATSPSGAATAKAPALHLVALELRLLAELPRFVIATRTRAMSRLPRGDGHAVMVVPGWGLDDRATRPLRRALDQLGYVTHGWGEGRNLGLRKALMQRLDERVGTLAELGPVSLIGWSYGGVVAREIARSRPESVRRVFSMGSPINGSPEANTISAVYRLLGRKTSAVDGPTFEKRRAPPPVACVAIHTKSDGIVAWQCSLEHPAPHTENVEVRGSHSGLVTNLEVLKVLADRLPLAAIPSSATTATEPTT